MDSQELIELVKDEMVCANSCPQFQISNYDLDKCTCYKKEVIAAISRMSGTTVFVIEKESAGNPGCMLNKYIGNLSNLCGPYIVSFGNTYKFYDRRTAVDFLKYLKRSFDMSGYYVTEHEMVS